MQIRNYTAATKVVGGTGGLIEDYIYKHGGTLKSHKQQSIRVSVNKVGWAIHADLQSSFPRVGPVVLTCLFQSCCSPLNNLVLCSLSCAAQAVPHRGCHQQRLLASST